MILYSEFADGFQFSEDKKRFGIFFFVAEIFNKYIDYTFFMRHPLLPSSAHAQAQVGLSWLYSQLIQPPTHPHPPG